MGTVHAKSIAEPETKQSISKSSRRHTTPPMKRRQESETSREVIHLKGIRARVDKVHVDGLSRTKDDIIKAQVTELFKAENFEDVVTFTQKVHSRLEALGCFKSIWVFIDTSRGPNASPEGVEVTFNVRELKRLSGEVSTMVGNNEGSLVVRIETPNIFGRGEKVGMEYSYGNKSTANINVSATKRFLSQNIDTILTGSVFNTSYDFPWSGYKQCDKGFLIDVSANTNSALTHTCQYEGVFRQIMAARQASFSVREQCGPNLKSAFRHICTLDKRDSSLFPTAGSLVKFSTEVAGFGGDIGFVKNEFALQSNWTPHELCTFQLGFQAGLLRSISNDKKISIADKLFLGGPLNLRGFDMRGCGPHDSGSSLGGDAYWAAALHMYTSLPFLSARSSFNKLFKLHGFVNGGNVADLSFNSSKDYTKLFTHDVRCSIGAGIAMKLGNVARVELNFIHPLLFVKSDVLRPFQFGIGIQYL